MKLTTLEIERMKSMGATLGPTVGETITQTREPVPSREQGLGQGSPPKRRPPCPVIGSYYQSLWIPAWHPTPLNKIVGAHWAKGAKLKSLDLEIIGHAVRQTGLLSSEQPRRVSLHIILRPGQRSCDPDAYWKSTLDALVLAGMLRGDTPRFCTLGPVWYSRSLGDHWGTMILLEELP